MRALSLFFLLTTALCSSGADLSSNAGTFRIDANGKMELQVRNGETLTLQLGVFLPTWKFHCQTPLRDTKTLRETPREFERIGLLRAKEKNLPCILKGSVEEGKFLFEFALTLPDDLKTQNNLPPYLTIGAAAGTLDGTLTRFGSKTLKLPADNSWSYGKEIFIQKYALRLELLNGAQSISIWGKEKHPISFRIPLKLEQQKNGIRIYRTKFRLSSASGIRLSEALDLLQVKREQYLRVLYPPMEPEFKPGKWIAMLNAPDLSHKQLKEVELALDTRAELYSIRERLVHSRVSSPALREGIRNAYAKLNSGNEESARAMLPNLEKLAETLPSLPLESYNPFTWIKSFTQYGYFKHADGCSLIEPNPFCVLFQDGFRFAIAEMPGGERVGDGAFQQIRYTRPMAEISVERSWVATKWNLPGQTVTFSMLTPVINVEDTDTLILSDFSRPPTGIGYVNEQMRLWGTSLKDMTRRAETIASVLVDNRDTGDSRIAGSTYFFKPHYPGRPWIVLSSKDDAWSLILILGERPLSASLKDGRFILKLEKKSHIGIVRLPFARHPREAAGLAEFFTETTLDYPTGVTEIRQGDTVCWEYQYKKRTNAWNTAARRIAPLSPLLQLGNVTVPNERKSSFNTKYGMYSYVEGEKAVFRVPHGRISPLFGVNTPLNPDQLLRHAKEGAQWQRIYIRSSKDPEQTYRKVEETLKFCAENKIKVLVDPHDFMFKVSWNTGFPASEEGLAPFLEMWDRLSQMGAKYPEAVAGYDLYNELGIKEGGEHRWREIAQRCVKRIRKNDPHTPIFVTGLDGANPSGHFNYRPPEDGNLVATFHFYTPHSLTHQKTSTRIDNDPFVFYPGYAPRVDWKKRIHYGGETVDWFDRWTLAAILLPVWETGISTGLPLHCGEFAVVGYANASAENSAFLWTRDVCELFRHADVSWHLWNQGFGLVNRRVRQYIFQLWNSRTNERTDPKIPVRL